MSCAENEEEEEEEEEEERGEEMSVWLVYTHRGGGTDRGKGGHLKKEEGNHEWSAAR